MASILSLCRGLAQLLSSRQSMGQYGLTPYKHYWLIYPDSDQGVSLAAVCAEHLMPPSLHAALHAAMPTLLPPLTGLDLLPLVSPLIATVCIMVPWALVVHVIYYHWYKCSDQRCLATNKVMTYIWSNTNYTLCV